MISDQATECAREIDRLYLAHWGDAPERDDEGTSVAHLRWMVQQIAGMPSDKANRWLGYIQGALVVKDMATLDQMKEVSRAALSSGDHGK